MTLKEQIMKLQTYKMFENEDTVYVERDDVLKALEQQPCDDCISRQAVKEMLTGEWIKYMPMGLDMNLSFVIEKISELPSVTPKYTDEEIDRAQAVEQAYIDKMVELTVEEWCKDGRK